MKKRNIKHIEQNRNKNKGTKYTTTNKIETNLNNK